MPRVYQSIQACRGIASLLVLFFHLGGTVALDRYFSVMYFNSVFSFGDAGVAFFFVLSGFVITLAHRKEIGHPKALLTYARKRAVRIYPAYLIVAGAVYLVAQFVPSISSGMPQDALGLVSELLLIPRDPKVTGGTGSTILLVAWSLQYEVFFYLLTALLLLRPALWIIAVAALLSLQLAVATGMAAPFPLSFLSNECILLFGFGMALAWLVKSPIKIAAPRLIAAAGIAAFTGLAFYELLIDKVPHRDLAYGLASCFIIVGLARTEGQADRPWKLPRLAMLGDASYALYLIHFPLISVIAKAARALGMTGLAGATAVFVVGTVASIGIAILFHLWIERPIMRRLSARKPQPGPDRPGNKALSALR